MITTQKNNLGSSFFRFSRLALNIQYGIQYVLGHNATRRCHTKEANQNEPGFWARFRLALSPSKPAPSREAAFQMQVAQNTEKLREFQEKLLTLSPLSPQDPQYSFTKIIDSLQQQAQRVREAGPVYYTTQQDIFDVLLRDAENKLGIIEAYNNNKGILDRQFEKYKNLLTNPLELHQADIDWQNYRRLTAKLLNEILVPRDLQHFVNLEDIARDSELNKFQTQCGARLTKKIKQTHTFLVHKEMVSEMIDTLFLHTNDYRWYAPSDEGDAAGLGKTPHNLKSSLISKTIDASRNYLETLQTTEGEKIQQLYNFIHTLDSLVRSGNRIGIAKYMVDPNTPTDWETNKEEWQAKGINLQDYCTQVKRLFDTWNKLVPVFCDILREKKGEIPIKQCINKISQDKRYENIQDDLNKMIEISQHLEGVNPEDYKFNFGTVWQ